MVPNMMDIIVNMLTAAEACFEVEPSPLNETWWNQIGTKFVPNEGQKMAKNQTRTKQKRPQRGTKGNKTKMAETR